MENYTTPNLFQINGNVTVNNPIISPTIRIQSLQKNIQEGPTIHYNVQKGPTIHNIHKNVRKGPTIHNMMKNVKKPPTKNAPTRQNAGKCMKVSALTRSAQNWQNAGKCTKVGALTRTAQTWQNVGKRRKVRAIAQTAKKLMRKETIPASLRSAVWRSYNGRVMDAICQVKWCDNQITFDNFHVGHNVPESMGGETVLGNLVPICQICNCSMGNKYSIDEFSEMYADNRKKSKTQIP